MQATATASIQLVAALPEQAERMRQQEALIGRLVAEAEEAECIAADVQEQLQQLQGAKRCGGMLLLQKCSCHARCLQAARS